MVTRVYRCKNCDENDKAFQENIHFDEKRYCEKCGKELIRVIGLINFILMGDGWANHGYCKVQK
jgi:predicted nucleic acid-binding Zn ribbon protein